MGKYLIFLIIFTAFVTSDAFCLTYKKEELKYKDHLKDKMLYVLVTLDGSYRTDKWEEIIKLSEENINATVYVSAVYFLNEEEKYRYICPFNAKISGISNVGFGSTKELTDERIGLVKKAQKQGVSIQSHLNGHFEGSSKWSNQMWDLEFKQYFLFTQFLEQKSQHIRFPYLEYNYDVYDVFEKYGIRSIVSTITRPYVDGIYTKISVMDDEKVRYFFYEFPISFVKYNKCKTIMMDYNFFVKDKKEQLSERQIMRNVEKLYLKQAKHCFKNNMPLFISHHFFMDGNEAYWKSLKNVTVKLKKIYKNKIKFITIDELYDILSTSDSIMSEEKS
ncbi:MAG: polysaccharide deacetylase family protein [Endomicrobium sp.]|nr:polysaccharide deacetylase family protein [Endomicrobium sp.]